MNHLAIIADGNRRWAKANNLPVEAGYTQGLTVIERCCEWAIQNNIPYLTVYVFSTENWNRPQNQVDNIMDLARWYFQEQKDWYIARGIRVRFTGRRDRLAKDIVEDMVIMERETENGNALTITLCADYGGRDEIIRAVADGARTESEISAAISRGIPDPDAILRTGGEYRLSNFLLWQSAYAELLFTPVLFPELSYEDLDAELNDYKLRKRNYGA